MLDETELDTAKRAAEFGMTVPELQATRVVKAHEELQEALRAGDERRERQWTAFIGITAVRAGWSSIADAAERVVDGRRAGANAVAEQGHRELSDAIDAMRRLYIGRQDET